jgi:DNA-binding transcriptional ArsR family regulator
LQHQRGRFPAEPKPLLETGKGAPAPNEITLYRWESCFATQSAPVFPSAYSEHNLDIDKVFKALADPGRRRLLDQLHADNGQTLTALCEHMDMTRQAVTQHLQQLEAANLVAVTWLGREKLHYLNPVPLFEIQELWIKKFERNRLGVLLALKTKLEGQENGNGKT